MNCLTCGVPIPGIHDYCEKCGRTEAAAAPSGVVLGGEGTVITNGQPLAPSPDDALREKMHKAASSCDGHVTNGSLAAIMTTLDRAVREAESRTASSLYGLRQAQEKRHQDELVALREECAKACDYECEGVHEEVQCHMYDAKVIRSLSPSGALERIQATAKLEAAKWLYEHLKPFDDEPLRNEQICTDYIDDLEAKLAPKDEVK